MSANPRPEIRVLRDAEALASAAALELAASIDQRARESAVHRLVLAGGRTPAALYRCLSSPPLREHLPWNAVEFFFGDERCVPADHADSNYRTAHENLLSRVDLSPAAVHRIQGELGAARAAADYEQVLARAAPPSPQRFDLVLLGMGIDGHTASLFPGSPALDDHEHFVLPAMAPSKPRERVTLSLSALCSAREVLLLVSGGDKAAAVARVIASYTAQVTSRLPAARVVPVEGKLLWMIDEAAAVQLTPALRSPV